MPPGAIPFPFGDCRICNDRATGIHYGLATCEGCKGFFKRSIPKGDKYKCFFGGQCIITPQNRNRCKSCRYRKCLELGMSFEAVKMGRIPKIEKQKALNAARHMDSGHKDQCIPIESPDSGIEEEGYKTNNWNDVLPVQQSGYFPQSVDMSNSGPRGACGSAVFENMGSSVFSTACSQEPEYRDIMMRNYHKPELIPGENPAGLSKDRSETSNMNLLAETALLPSAPQSSTEDSMSTDSSTSSRSLYSPDVIKVLFNQVVEMTGKNKVPDMVIQKLAQKCPNTSSARLLKHLSSESYLGEPVRDSSVGDPKHQDTCREWSPVAGQLFISDGRDGSTENWNKPHLTPDSGFHPCHQQTMYFPRDSGPSDTPVNNSDDIHFKSRNPVNYQSEGRSMQISLDSNMYDAQTFNLPSSSLQEESFNNTISMEGSFSDHHPQEGQVSERERQSSWLQVSHQPMCASETDMEQSSSCMEVFEGKSEEKTSYGESGKDEESFDALLQGLQVALDRNNADHRQKSAFVKEMLAKKVSMHKPEITEETVKETWDQLFKSVDIANKRIIGFCSAVPGFADLNVDDQKILLKRAYYNIWMLTSSEFFIDGESYLQFPNGQFYNRFWMEYIIKKENVKLLHSFAESFNRLKLSELEIGILAAIELTSPGHADLDLQDSAAIQKLNSTYLDLLVYIITQRNPDNSSRILVDIFRLLPKLAEINKMQQDLIANFASNMPPR